MKSQTHSSDIGDPLEVHLVM